jgi:ketosteroid isomerase-like protein
MSARHAFRAAVEAGDQAALLACFREDAVLHSPVSFTPFEGKEAIARLFAILLEVFQDFRYTDQLEAPDGTLGLVFRARVGKREVQGIDLVRFDPEGRIVDFTVMVRPRSALEALFEAVSSRLAQQA